MTRFWLIMLRIICIIQTLIAIVQCFTSLFGLLMGGGFMLLLQAIAFGFIAALPILTFTIYNRNFPDRRIEGSQKKYFNRIFIINFLLHNSCFRRTEIGRFDATKVKNYFLQHYSRRNHPEMECMFPFFFNPLC